MLVMQRSEGESVVIALPDGRTVKVTMVERRRGKLGFTSDKDIVIHREEVYEAIHGRKLGEDVPPVLDI